jgi:hypothetical protein
LLGKGGRRDGERDQVDGITSHGSPRERMSRVLDEAWVGASVL